MVTNCTLRNTSGTGIAPPELLLNFARSKLAENASQICLALVQNFPFRTCLTLLPCRRSRDTSTNDTWQLLRAHLPDSSNGKSNHKDHTNSEEHNEPELNADVLLLACRSSPICGLLAVLALGRSAAAGVAVQARITDGAVVVFLAAGTMASAIAGGTLAC